MNKVRRRITYANVVATLALVFAMSGGALAASRYLITSTRQIKPSVLSALKGSKGSKGATGVAGLQGAAGPAGAEGKTGPEGKAGVEGKVGPEGKLGPEGKVGPEGKPYEHLPKGMTETGVWTVDSNTEGATIPISFPVSLSEELPADDVHFVTKKEWAEQEGHEPPPACTGTNLHPSALTGNLCVYESELEQGTEFFEFQNPYDGITKGAGTGGTIVFLFTASPPISGNGTWAVTGP